MTRVLTNTIESKYKKVGNFSRVLYCKKKHHRRVVLIRTNRFKSNRDYSYSNLNSTLFEDMLPATTLSVQSLCKLLNTGTHNQLLNARKFKAVCRQSPVFTSCRRLSSYFCSSVSEPLIDSKWAVRL